MIILLLLSTLMSAWLGHNSQAFSHFIDEETETQRPKILPKVKYLVAKSKYDSTQREYKNK